MQHLNKLLLRQADKYLGGWDKIPENYRAFMNAINESYEHYEKDHRMLERSIELSSEEMIELNEQLKNESEELKKAHDELRATEKIRMEKRLDEEKIKRLQEISEVGVLIQERERSYLGAELHDNINQVLATSMLYIDTAMRNEEKRLSLMKDSKAFVFKAIQEIRVLSKSLLPPLLSETTLISAIGDMLYNIEQLGRVEIVTEWKNIDETPLNDNIKLNIFRIIQEQLTNILKHAKAKKIIIGLQQNDHCLRLSIKDDGVGFDLEQKRNGIGLQNIANRTKLLNGDILINTKPAEGCELIITFPIQAKLIQQRKAS